MADNVAVTAGVGTAIHADEYTHSTLGAGKTQMVKLIDGTLDSSTAIVAGGGVEANALRVTIASDSTGVLSIDDNGASITVDGTVTANLSATDNTVLDNIDTSTAGILSDTASIETSVQLIDDVIATLGTTTYTEATTKGAIIGAVRRDADTSLVDTTNEIGPLQMNALGQLKVEVFSGEALPVTLTSTTITGTVAATQSGTWVIGAGTSNIGDVDVLSLPALPAGTNNIGDVDVLSIAAGDNNIGNVDVVTLPNVTVGTMANLTESLVDDAAFTPATSRVLPVGFTFDDVTPDSVNEGDIGAARMSANRNIFTTLRDAAGNERGVNVTAGNALTVDGSASTQPISGTVTANLSATDNAVLDAIEADTTTLAGAVAGTEMQVDIVSAPTLTVNAHAVTNAGTFAVQVDGSALTALQLIDDSIFADDAAFTLASSKTTVVGAIRDDSLSTLTAIEGDVVPFRVSSTGALHVTGGGGGTEYTEDVASAADPVGTALILVRKDTPATITTTDSDNVAQRGTNYGAAYVQLVTSSGAYIDSVGGGTEYTEDVATANPIVGKAIMIERDDALTTVTPIEGDNIGLRGTAEGALWTQDFNSDAILADTTAIKTAVEILDNAISGSEMQVDIVSSATLTVNAHAVTNAGTFAVQVDGAALTALQLLDDTVATLGTTTYTEAATKGNIIGAVRRDADTTLVDTTNEVGPLQMNAAGQLKVEVFSGEALPVTMTSTTITGTVAVTQSGTWDEVGINDSGNSITVDNGGTFVVQENGAALTALQLIDNVVHVDDAAFTLGTSSGVMMMGFAGTQSVNANDAGAIAMETDGSVHIHDGGNTITVDGTVTANLSATDNAVLDAIEADTTTIAGAVSGTEMQVDVVAALPAGDNNIGNVDIVSGTVTTVSTVTALTGGGVAHDGADSGNPHKIGGRAQEPTAQLEEVSADNDRVDAAFDRQGRLAVWNGYPVQSAAINTSTSGDNTIVAAAGAGLRIAVLGCIIVSDGTTDVRWEDGASGTAKTGQIPLQAREGFVLPIGIQPWFVGTANTLLNLELTAAINVHGIVSYVTMQD